MKDIKQLLRDILLKKAKGYVYKEKTEEYNIVDGEEKPVKKKVTAKQVQPDVSAIKALLQLSEQETDVSELTDEQLQVEKLRLLELLNICDATSTEPPRDDSED